MTGGGWHLAAFSGAIGDRSENAPDFRIEVLQRLRRDFRGDGDDKVFGTLRLRSRCSDVILSRIMRLRRASV